MLSERLAISAGVAVHGYADPGSGNRFFRFDASPGHLMVAYKAQVEVATEPVEDDLPEAPVGQVPDQVFHSNQT